MENVNLDLEVKLEDKNVIPTRSITEAPPATSDVATILQQMAKQWGDIQKQLGKQFADSQKESREQFASSQKEMADKFSEALKVSGKPKFKVYRTYVFPKTGH